MTLVGMEGAESQRQKTDGNPGVFQRILGPFVRSLTWTAHSFSVGVSEVRHNSRSQPEQEKKTHVFFSYTFCGHLDL